MKIAKSTVLIYIAKFASKIVKPIFKETNQEYEIDELRTYIKHKENECWIIYAINKKTKNTIDFAVGKRNKLNIKKVVDTVLLLNPKRIFTDKLNIYPMLITDTKHISSKHKINHIERKNLNLRKDIKCLNRKTICYAKSEENLDSKLQLYFY